MNYNEKYFDAAAAMLNKRRQANLLIIQKRRDEIYSRLPKYAELEHALSQTSASIIRLMLTETEDRQKRLQQIESTNLEMQREMNSLLTDAGYPTDYLEEIYSCPICKDKGNVDGKWCECFNKLMLNAAAAELNEVSPLKLSSFDGFRLDVYSDAKDDKLGMSPREIMSSNLRFCRSYADSFSTDSDSIFMSGGTGLGKTHLSLAIAERVMSNGFSVIYGSAPELLRDIERQHFGNQAGDTMDSLTRCDLMILDDLGAEVDKPLNTSLLYELLNARISRGLPMIINSNFGPSDLKVRYQDRIWSRIFSFEVLMFIGNDVRRKIKK